MSRLRHEKGLRTSAGAGSGVHRLEVGKPRPFKPIEERKHGGHIEGHRSHHKLGRKRGGSVRHDHNPDVDTPDRGTKYGTHVQETRMTGHDADTGRDFRRSPTVEEGVLKYGGKLTYKERKALPKSTFVFPGERRYPINDEAHGRNALARVAQHGTPAEKQKVRAAVHRKFPGIGKS